MDKLRIYLVGHNEDVYHCTPPAAHLRPVNVSELPLGKYQTNQLSESRIYLSDIIKEEVEYIGFFPYSWAVKCQNIPRPMLLPKLPYRPDLVYYAKTPNPDWGYWMELHQPGMHYLLNDMADFAGITLGKAPTPLMNTFICHWHVFQRFHAKWLEVFHYMHNEYPPESMTFQVPDPTRRAGYLYECLTALVFSGMSDVTFELPRLKTTKLFTRRASSHGASS